MNDRNKTLQLVFSPNNKILACGNEDTTVQVWDVTTRDSLAVIEAHISETTAITFSSDSSTLATASSDGTVLPMGCSRQGINYRCRLLDIHQVSTQLHSLRIVLRLPV